MANRPAPFRTGPGNSRPSRHSLIYSLRIYDSGCRLLFGLPLFSSTLSAHFPYRPQRGSPHHYPRLSSTRIHLQENASCLSKRSPATAHWYKDQGKVSVPAAKNLVIKLKKTTTPKRGYASQRQSKGIFESWRSGRFFEKGVYFLKPTIGFVRFRALREGSHKLLKHRSGHRWLP